MNLNDIDLIRYNGSDISLIKWNSFILYQVSQEPEIPLYAPEQFRGNTTITEVNTMVNTSHNSLDYMFDGCTSLTTVNTTDWDTSNVTTMNSMFYSCVSLTQLDLSSFDTSNVTYMNNMFYNCVALETLDIRNFTAPSFGQTDGVFDGCTKLHTIRMDNCDNRAIRRLIYNQDNFPTNEIEGVTRKIYVKQASLTDQYGTLTAPTNWKFVPVD
jgi:surface protein